MDQPLKDLAAVIMEHTPDTRDRAAELTRKALATGVEPERIIDEGLVAGMADVGRRFRDNEIFVPEVLLSARAMQAALDVLEPVLAEYGLEPVGRCVLGTVQGDIHDIGKNLVSMMLRGAGFEVVDLGVNVSLQKFDAAIEEHEPHLVGMSALLTTTMPRMEKNIAEWSGRGWTDRFSVMVGGAPVSEAWAAEIGADGYGRDAASAVDLALSLMEARRGPRAR
ncbi:MAG: corrinoid protein [Gemmatimonadota bacterium]|nr:corrinoid protein [Gemmatimonadota bacterium]MDH5758933.1 corrinoid protein [Gemmatimonadota bacterium]